MSAQIRFRLSGEEEKAFEQAALRAGLTPNAYAKARALAPVDPAASQMELVQRLATLEVMLKHLSRQVTGAGAHVKGLSSDDLLLAVREECSQGVSAFLRILGADLPESSQDAANKNH